ncbi:MAG: radical SAM protein [Nanoarchaeota archaeon]|nr:radical SAM protein [Nanoarchaeota archaeon]
MRGETEPIHDFSRKLSQPSIIKDLRDYVRWLRGGSLLEISPISINLDPTSACNFDCNHCIDKGIINKGHHLEYKTLENSLKLMHEKGLKSVILIGGGEPTLYKKFEGLVKFLKDIEIQIAIVTNGTKMEKIREVGEFLTEGDWVRLSLDAGTEQTFNQMHNPKIDITLQQICEQTKLTKKHHPNLQIGYSFVITPHSHGLIPNIDEMEIATKLAKDYLFNYISFKPILGRNSNDSEVLAFNQIKEKKIKEKIKENYKRAKGFESEDFKVVETNNLGSFLRELTYSPSRKTKRCHLQFFRQVLTPTGIYTCPGYRGNKKFKVGESEGYSSEENFKETNKQTSQKILNLDTSKECHESTCLYASTNQYIEYLIKNPEKLTVSQERGDYFL